MLLIRYINFIACPLLQLLSELNNKITQTKNKNKNKKRINRSLRCFEMCHLFVV